MEHPLISVDGMLSELILNGGYTKQQLAFYLRRSLLEIDKALAQSQTYSTNKKFRPKLKHFYLSHHC